MRLGVTAVLAAAVMTAPAIASPSTSGPPGPSAPVQHYVDLNSASRNELMTLPGIGAPEAARIIANRPYLIKTELVTKNVLPVGPFVSVRHLVVAMPKSTTTGGK